MQLIEFSKKLIKNKYIEIEFLLNKDFWYWFKFNIDWSRKQDHAGLNLIINLVWFYFYIQIYDCRHWNEDENRWYSYDEEEKL